MICKDIYCYILQVTFGFLVPPLILFLAKNPMVDEYDLSALKDVICGAAPLSGDLAEEFQKRLKVPVIRQGNVTGDRLQGRGMGIVNVRNLPIRTWGGVSRIMYSS